ncbi:MAG: type II toxin-antitoxin system VapC family toxin [Bacteroidota bacterium]
MEKLFVDTDVVLDLLSARQPHYKFAAELFSLADMESIRLYVSSLTFANVHYVLSKQLSATESRKLLLRFKTLVTVLPVNDKIIELALSSSFADFEDAIQFYAAIENNISILLTRNLKDFKKATIPVMTPQQYLKSSD